MLNWEEFCIIKETPKTQENERIENDLDIDEEENDVAEQILKFLLDEETDKEEITKENNDQINIDNLGTSINQEGFRTPKCVKSKMKRGRK